MNDVHLINQLKLLITAADDYQNNFKNYNYNGEVRVPHLEVMKLLVI